MALTKVKDVFKVPGKKPTRFRFKGDNIRLGFRNNKVVEVTKFKQTPRREKK